MRRRTLVLGASGRPARGVRVRRRRGDRHAADRDRQHGRGLLRVRHGDRRTRQAVPAEGAPPASCPRTRRRRTCTRARPARPTSASPRPTSPATATRPRPGSSPRSPGIYDDYVHLVVAHDSPIKTVDDLRGRRVSVGAAGSGTASPPITSSTSPARPLKAASPAAAQPGGLGRGAAGRHDRRVLLLRRPARRPHHRPGRAVRRSGSSTSTNWSRSCATSTSRLLRGAGRAGLGVPRASSPPSRSASPTISSCGCRCRSPSPTA